MSIPSFKPTTWHCHFDVDYLLAQSDGELSTILIGGTSVEMRAMLVCLKAAGKTKFVGSGCNNKCSDGSCAGHQKESKT